ncbi:MAG: hypothetical protein IPH94_14765 [Saprospiraceae bacterium]|nr:hypothetical protein [Saprospiraceae bacterium]
MYRLMMLVVGFTFTAVAASAGFQPYFHTVKAKSGDAISTLLSKYELSVHSCNTEKFYELNGIKRGQNYLPVRNTSFRSRFTNTMEKAFGPL